MSKRLLFITPIFPKNASEDAVVPFIIQFAQKFGAHTNVKIDVISLMYPFTTKHYSIDGIEVYPIGSRFRTSIYKVPYLIRAIYKGSQLCRKNNYDGILCFWYRESALVGKILSSLFRKKLTVWMLGQDINKDNLYLKLLKIPTPQLIMISNQQRQFFYQNHQLKVNTIANVAITRELFPELNMMARNIDVLGVGNLGALKNYTVFIELLADLKSKHLKAAIIGAGEELEMLKEQAFQLGVADNIQFLGSVSHAQVLAQMNNAKVFLHTSKSEGSGTVLHEALYSGCKVVSTIDIEDGERLKSFYFSTHKQELSVAIQRFLADTSTPERVEHFKMEDTVAAIYNRFYSD